MNVNREIMNYDLVIIGAGPSGLAAAINFKNLCKKHEKNYTVCVVEKGSEVGAHILSGAILQPTALNELIENWQNDERLFLSWLDQLFCYYLRCKIIRC